MHTPWTVLIDDGELDDVREILDDMGAEYVHWNKRTVPIAPIEPTRLLVTTPSHAASRNYRRAPGRAEERAVWLAVTDTDSNSQRNLILQSGFDFLIRRPVHSLALRMLLERALYRGEEQRSRNRVAVGYAVTYRAGLRNRSATLVDLSPGGCRLLARQRLDHGFKITLNFPREITGDAPFSHSGVVVRTASGVAEGGDDREFTVGVRFARYTPDVRDKMLALLNRLCTGPATLPDPEGEVATTPLSQRSKPKPCDKREPRGVYESEVGIFGLDNCVLVGRDLSAHGLRVDKHPAMLVGAEIRLALPVGDDPEPVVVGARVVRDDGERGIALKFEWVDGGDESRLERLVASLQKIEMVEPETQEPQTVVLTQLVPTLLRRSKS